MGKIDMEIDSVRHAMHRDEWVVLLKERLGERYFPIYVGSSQADAITRALEDKPFSESLGDFCSLPHIVTMLPMVESASVVIGRLDRDAFFATLSLAYRGRSYGIELPAATALILGVRAGAHISADESVLEKAGVTAATKPTFAIGFHSLNNRWRGHIPMSCSIRGHEYGFLKARMSAIRADIWNCIWSANLGEIRLLV